MNLIDNRKNNKNNTKVFVENLKEDVYVLGTNKYGVEIVRWLSSININVLGYINDFTQDKSFNHLPIVASSHDFSRNAIVNCIVEGRTIDAQKSIEQSNALKFIDYFALQFAFENVLIAVDFLSNTDSIIDHLEDYQLLYSQLQDDVSKKHLEDISNFRFNREIKFLEDFEFKLMSQYFEDFIHLESDAAFIDAGGFDGGTTKMFTQLYPNYKETYYFEPTLASFENSKENLKGIERVNYFNKGVWNKTETLVFNNTLGSANKISDIGNSSIEVTSIDEVVERKVEYIKMDIEGAEIQALIGAKEYIKKYKPQLAICVYHNQEDFHKIPELVLEFNPEYKIYLRHYTQGIFETVMYFTT